MKYILLAASVLLAACGTPKPVVTAKHDCNGHPTTERDKAIFDNLWGPEVRKSEAYRVATLPGAPCDAVYDLVHPPGYRNSPAWQAERAAYLEPYDKLLDDINRKNLEADLNYRLITAPSYYGTPTYYHRHHHR